uniref:Protein-tyrosine-phosphatase n=1 Tax=Hemiselmis tepida TaxID=464990 RepID=A0A7S0VW28_9CRYP
MRRQMQEILPSVFLGPYGAAKDREALTAKGVTHVLIVRSTLERRLDPKFPDELKYHIVEVPEGPTENLILYFTECNKCIQQALADGGKILVHCNAGLSRSAAVVCAYVMESMWMPYNEAIQHVQCRRCCIHISEALLNQLREFEAIYQNRTAAPHRDGWAGKKRPHEKDDEGDMVME